MSGWATQQDYKTHACGRVRNDDELGGQEMEIVFVRLRTGRFSAVA